VDAFFVVGAFDLAGSADTLGVAGFDYLGADLLVYFVLVVLAAFCNLPVDWVGF